MPCEFLREFRDETDDPDPVNQVSRLELRGYMAHMLLRDSDVFSMISGIELRVPFLDHEVVAAALRLPGAWKQRDPRPKPLLIDAAGPRLPAFLHRLPKKGFTLPWGQWFHGPLRCQAARAVQNQDVWAALGFNPAAPIRTWERFQAGDARVSPLQLLAYLALEDFVTRHGLSA